MAFDPNDALERMRGLVREIQERERLESSNQNFDDPAVELAGRFEDLDEHFRRGGSAPKDWTPVRGPARLPQACMN